MFYADFVLSKKGPLARIWLAAHWDKKLTKTQIFETNIESSIERILKPKVKLALRTSGHLMLGVVRIYSRKTKYLLADCNEAFVKIKMAFRPGMVDLPEDHREAAVNAVTLPEVFHDFDSAIPDLNDVDIEAQFQVNQSRADEITIREDYGAVPTLQDGFDLGGFDATNAFLGHGFDQTDPSNATGRDAYDQSLQPRTLLEDIDMADKQRDRPSTSDASGLLDLPRNLDSSKVDDFGAVTGGEFLGLFEDPEVHLVPTLHDPMNVDQDQAIPSTSKMLSPSGSPRKRLHDPDMLNDDDDFDDHFIPPSPGGGSSIGSRPASPIPSAVTLEDGTAGKDQFPMQVDVPDQQAMPMPQSGDGLNQAGDQNEGIRGDQTTLLQNEEESFALAPVDASALRGLPKTKRKRKLIVDEVKNISGEEMKAQLSDTSDIVITLDLAPPTKRLMHWKETGGVEKLFALPGKGIPSTALFKNYQRHLTSRAAPCEEGFEDRENLDGFRDVDAAADANAQQPAATPSRRGRKRKQGTVEDEPAVTDVAAEQEATKKTRMSPQQADTNAAAASVIDQVANVNDGTMENMGYDGTVPDQDPNLAQFPFTDNLNQNSVIQSQWKDDFGTPMPQQLEDREQGNVDDVSRTAESNQMANKDSMLENMGYDGNDQDIQNQDPNVPQFSFNDDHDLNPITPGLNAGGGITPWHDADYDNPPSLGPPLLEEREQQRVDETMEQFEERILNKRAGQLYSTIRMRVTSGVTTTFDDLIISNSRKQIAQRFYSLLVLKKHRVLELTQEMPYGTIVLTKGSNFDDPQL